MSLLGHHLQAMTEPHCCAVTGESPRLCQWRVLLPLDSVSIVFSTSFLHLELPGCVHFLSWLPCNVELLWDYAGFGWVRRKEQEGSVSRSETDGVRASQIRLLVWEGAGADLVCRAWGLSVSHCGQLLNRGEAVEGMWDYSEDESDCDKHRTDRMNDQAQLESRSEVCRRKWEDSWMKTRYVKMPHLGKGSSVNKCSR